MKYSELRIGQNVVLSLRDDPSHLRVQATVTDLSENLVVFTVQPAGRRRDTSFIAIKHPSGGLTDDRGLTLDVAPAAPIAVH